MSDKKPIETENVDPRLTLMFQEIQNEYGTAQNLDSQNENAKSNYKNHIVTAAVIIGLSMVVTGLIIALSPVLVSINAYYLFLIFVVGGHLIHQYYLE